ncbi:MAG: hypothetical protein ACTS4W_01780 [Candidatus Hodgkinia cicadicola]
MISSSGFTAATTQSLLSSAASLLLKPAAPAAVAAEDITKVLTSEAKADRRLNRRPKLPANYNPSNQSAPVLAN